MVVRNEIMLVDIIMSANFLKGTREVGINRAAEKIVVSMPIKMLTPIS